MDLGLRFRKADLHMHTPASKCFLDKGVTPEGVVRAALGAGLDIIAVTDHNTGEWVDRVKRAAEGTSLAVFPGVEITVAGGFHIVALFDRTKGTPDIVALLGALDIPPGKHGRSDTICPHGALDVAQKIAAWDGLAILAHVDQPKGAFTSLSGLPLISLINEAPLAAMETETGLPPDNLDKGHGFLRVPPCFQASDNPDPGQTTKHSLDGLGSRHCYLKLDREVTLEGVRQCFADPGVRIRCMGGLADTRFPTLLSMKASAGFLQHQNIRFHQGLNSIIGGKGTGKSLIVEFIRFALDQGSDNLDIKKDHDGKLAKCLGPGSTVEVGLRLPSGTEYLVTRIVGGEHRCTDLSTGEAYEGRIGVLLPVLAYSQTEVIHIAADEDAQLRLVDSFLDPRPHLSLIGELRSQLSNDDALLARAIRSSFDLQDHRRDLETLDVKIGEIDRTLADGEDETGIFREYQALDAKKRALSAQQVYFDTLQGLVARTRVDLEQNAPPVLPAGLDTDPDLVWVQGKANAARNGIDAALATALTEVAQQMTGVTDRISGWLPTFDAVREKYEAALADRREKQRLLNDRKALLAQRPSIQAKVDEHTALDARLPQLREERQRLLDALADAYGRYYAERKAVFDGLTAKSGGKLQLGLTHAANPMRFETQLTALLRGSGARGADIRTICAKLTPRLFADLASNRDLDGLARDTGISRNAAQTIVEKLWSGEDTRPILALQHSCFAEDVPSIQFRKDDGEYAPLTELSVGQKCTALMIIALSEGTRPVIIDQPEDALDIRTVWEDVSLRLRESKEKRQFILTTHNSSVAVSSDSDMFIVVRSNARQANVKCLGAIEHPDVRGAVIQHLEGGPEPYLLRHEKYNIQR